MFALLGIGVYQHFDHKKAGVIIRYEDFRGYKVPIKADGKGGTYKWLADVPWDKFTIEEKTIMAFKGGGWLSVDDIKEIQQKYGVNNGKHD
jgi:hypothetical protein